MPEVENLTRQALCEALSTHPDMGPAALIA
jgi:hypothetical protein